MVDVATQTMISNLSANTGRSLEDWFSVLRPLGLENHGEIMNVLKGEHGVSHGYANLISNRYRETQTGKLENSELVDAQYQGAKAELRPIHDALIDIVSGFGDDVEIAPKKTSVSLRRSKQFALITPATKTRVDLGLNLKGEPVTDRLLADKGMCTHRIALGSANEIDDEVIQYLRHAYDRA